MSSTVTVRFDINEETLQKAFPTAKSVKLNKSGKTATVEFENAQVAKEFANSVTSFQCPISQKPVVVFTRPDVSATAVDATKAITLVDAKTTTGGRIYKNQTDLSTRHVASLRFAPVTNSVILPQVDFNAVQIQVLSIIVQPEKEGRLAVYVRVFHQPSKRHGVLVFKRHVDEKTGETKFSRRCFDLLVSEADYKQSNDDVIPINFISIESITLDPATGLWSELKLALDQCDAKLALFRLGSKIINRGGKRSGPRSTRGGRPIRGRGGFRGGRRPARKTAPAAATTTTPQ